MAMTYKELSEQFNLLICELDKLPPLPDDPKGLHINEAARSFAKHLSAGARHEKFISEVREYVRLKAMGLIS